MKYPAGESGWRISGAETEMAENEEKRCYSNG
jgi:hypothetical protein